MDKKKIQKLIKDFSTYRIEVQTLEELTNYENNLIDKLDKAINYSQCCTELPIYMTYDNSDSEVFAAFTDKDRCELESLESGAPMQKTTLYFGKRK